MIGLRYWRCAWPWSRAGLRQRGLPPSCLLFSSSEPACLLSSLVAGLVFWAVHVSPDSRQKTRPVSSSFTSSDSVTRTPAHQFPQDLPGRTQALPEGLRDLTPGVTPVSRALWSLPWGMIISFLLAQFKTKREVGTISDTGRLPFLRR